MQVVETQIKDVKVLIPNRFGDRRGFFSETYNKRVLAEHGIMLDFVQDNHSLSAEKGTLRGLHFQTAPFGLDKLIRVVKGKIFDVAVDIRYGSPTYGKHVSVELSADDGKQLLVPVGFAHGFCTLEANTEVMYKVTNWYSPEHDKGLMWNDPDLNVPWPVNAKSVVLSDRDTQHPPFAALGQVFQFDK